MTQSAAAFPNTPGEHALHLIADAPGAVGALARACLEAQGSDESQWLEKWFEARTQKHYEETFSENDQVQSVDLTHMVERPESITPVVKILAIEPHYFRGFKALPRPVDLRGDLLVIEGRNSSGKTGLAEAMEFLFTGALSRRDEMGEENPQELESCISNQLRPRGETTWVEATLVEVTNEEPQEFVLRRLLVRDYGAAGTSNCESTLCLNGEEITKAAEREILDRLFASVPPLLMQHTLRSFVHSRPDERRRYFERLLKLDELTELIRVAVIGEVRLPEISKPHGGLALRDWESIGRIFPKNAPKARGAWRETFRVTSNIQECVVSALQTVAVESLAFPEQEENNLQAAMDWVQREQRRARQRSFPLLAKLRPARPHTEVQYPEEIDRDLIRQEIQIAWDQFGRAKIAAQAIGEGRLTINRALNMLVEAGLIDRKQALQICPLCVHDSPQTLSAQRIREIDAWAPAAELERRTWQTLERAIILIQNRLKEMLHAVRDTLPTLPEDEAIGAALAEVTKELQAAVRDLVQVRRDAASALVPFAGQAAQLIGVAPATLQSWEDCEKFLSSALDVMASFRKLPEHARAYAEAVGKVEVAAGTVAAEDPHYRARAIWFTCAEKSGEIANDLRWEQCKRQSQRDLEQIRGHLIDFRRSYLEARRIAFSDGMQKMWSTLRDDRYSAFSGLRIPEPRGRGYPVVMQVKAMLDDSSSQAEVDALRVFSESQVNALGIAAFITRTQLLGHRMLVFDDPVQSMDEDHFKTFARDVIPPLLDKGFQIILLTHNDTFARDVSFEHYNCPGYVTMVARQSRREGCQIDEGNRLVPERLKRAERLADDGQLKEAWNYVRYAIERLYTVTYIKHGPSDFDPMTWRDHTAEGMWNEGVGSIIEKLVPDSGQRLKGILDMTAGGSHDKPEQGKTEVFKSAAYLRSLLSPLRVGG